MLRRLIIYISILSAMAILFNINIWAVDEAPELVVNGTVNARTVIKNIDYNDLKNANYWSEEAIYTVSALDIMKGYGDLNFGRKDLLTKAQGIALAYRVAGREAEAIRMAETLEAQKFVTDREKDALKMWSSGYLMLAQIDALISAQDYQDSLVVDRTELPVDSFNADSPLKREDFAFYIAKLLKLEPTYGQQKIFNQFNDWKQTDPLRIPYVETILVNRIMNGDGAGNFFPKGNLTREEAAQVIKNTLPYIIKNSNFTRRIGTIEDIILSKSVGKGSNVIRKTFVLRNENGMATHVVIEKETDQTNSIKNEKTLGDLKNQDREVPVYLNGKVGDSNLLGFGNKVEYIVDDSNNVKFISGILTYSDVRYLVGRVENVDKDSKKITFNKIYTMFDKEEGLVSVARRFENFSSTVPETYVYSNSVKVYLLNEKHEIEKVVKDNLLKVEVINGIIRMIEEIRLDNAGYKSDVVHGVVDENNPYLGFITLFNADGTGVYDSAEERAIKLRTYEYDQYFVEVIKDGLESKAEKVKSGDRVFLKLGTDEKVIEISASSDATTKYGKVINIDSRRILVEFDDGTQKVYPIGDGVMVFKNSLPVEVKSIHDGDLVRLTLTEGGANEQEVLEIYIDNGSHLVSNIYKGVYYKYNPETDKVYLRDVERLDRRQWNKVDHKGIMDFIITPADVFYEAGGKYSIKTLNDSRSGREVYLAVEKDAAGREKVLLLSFQNNDDAENRLIKDTLQIYSVGSGEIGLENEYKLLKYDDGTIIVKNGRLVKASSMKNDEQAYVVARRTFEDNEYYAGIVRIDDLQPQNKPSVYRARILSIVEGREFVVESYSRFDGEKWQFYNLDKTFKLSHDTRFKTQNGVLGLDSFVDYGESSYKDQVVYIIADGEKVIEINIAPYAEKLIKGEAYSLSRINSDDLEVELVEQDVTKVWMQSVKSFNIDTGLWDPVDDVDLDIGESVIVIYNGEMVKSSAIREGDVLKILKQKNDANKEATMVFIEN